MATFKRAAIVDDSDAGVVYGGLWLQQGISEEFNVTTSKSQDSTSTATYKFNGKLRLAVTVYLTFPTYFQGLPSMYMVLLGPPGTMLAPRAFASR
jgi:hypothetical protein